MDFMDFSRRLYRWASEGVDMYVHACSIHNQLVRIPVIFLSFQCQRGVWR